MRSQRDTAPSRGLPERKSAARRRQRLGVVVHHDLEGAEMALGRFDRALHHRKFGGARQPQILGVRDHHGDIEMIGEQRAGLDGGFVTAINEDDPLALEADEGSVGHRLGGRSAQRRHRRRGRRGITQDGALFSHSGSDFGGRSNHPARRDTR